MIITFLSWLVSISAFYIVGRSIYSYAHKRGLLSSTGLDSILVIGFVAVTLYAQTLSLFMPVSSIAMGILISSVTLLTILQRKALALQLKEIKTQVISCSKPCLIICLMLTLLLTYLTSLEPIHCDAYLYHAQSIRWLEEFGIAKGLGNLHHRLAYNSAIMPIQALFSFAYFGQSLHSLNGLLILLALLYSLTTLRIWKKEQLRTSDFLKIGTFIYIFCGQWDHISSTGSDFPALLGALYVFIKCFELKEQQNLELTLQQKQSYRQISELSLFALFCTTLKLSTTPLVLIVLFPAYCLIQNKEWKRISGYLLLGLLILTPFIIRNIFLSGYIIYPCPALDFFTFDWKIPVSECLRDKIEITTWGRRIRYDEFHFNLRQWFPIWCKQYGPIAVTLLGVSFASQLINLFFATQRALKRDIFLLHLTLISSLCVTFWFFSAPLIRMGFAFILIPICMCASHLSVYFPKKLISYSTIIL